VESRGSCFSPCGLFLYSIQSPRRGQTFLIKWVLSKNDSGVLTVYPLVVVAASKVPSTRLKINAAGNLLALGTSDGSVHFFKTKTMKKVSSTTQHDLPVTGLGFAPDREDGLAVSCSADNKMSSMYMKVSGQSLSMLEILGVLLSILLLVFMFKQQMV